MSEETKKYKVIKELVAGEYVYIPVIYGYSLGSGFCQCWNEESVFYKTRDSAIEHIKAFDRRIKMYKLRGPEQETVYEEEWL